MIEQILHDGWRRYFIDLCPACREAIKHPGGEELAAKALNAGQCEHKYTGKLVPLR